MTARKLLDFSACYNYMGRLVVTAQKHITRLLTVDKALACWSACQSGLCLFELRLFVSWLFELCVFELLELCLFELLEILGRLSCVCMGCGYLSYGCLSRWSCVCLS